MVRNNNNNPDADWPMVGASRRLDISHRTSLVWSTKASTVPSACKEVESAEARLPRKKETAEAPCDAPAAWTGCDSR
jgi:hypothetical protein